MTVVVLLAAGAPIGGALGWWVLAGWVRRNLRSDWWPRARIWLALAGMLSFALIGWRIGWAWDLPAALVFAACGIAIAAVDLFERRIPNRMLIVAAALETVALLLGALGSGSVSGLLRAAAGAAAIFVVYLAIALISPGAMGMGDVKLAGFAGGVLGFFGLTALIVGTVAGVVIGGIAAVAVVLVRRRGVGGSIPYGPAIVLGAVVALLL